MNGSEARERGQSALSRPPLEVRSRMWGGFRRLKGKGFSDDIMRDYLAPVHREIQSRISVADGWRGFSTLRIASAPPVFGVRVEHKGGAAREENVHHVSERQQHPDGALRRRTMWSVVKWWEVRGGGGAAVREVGCTTEGRPFSQSTPTHPVRPEIPRVRRRVGEVDHDGREDHQGEQQLVAELRCEEGRTGKRGVRCEPVLVFCVAADVRLTVMVPCWTPLRPGPRWSATAPHERSAAEWDESQNLSALRFGAMVGASVLPV